MAKRKSEALPPRQREMIDEITLFYFPVAYVAAIGSGVRGAWRSHVARAQARHVYDFLSEPASARAERHERSSKPACDTKFRMPASAAAAHAVRPAASASSATAARLPQPSGREAFVLERVGVSADPSIRLACQLRPQTDVAVIPVLPPNVGTDFLRSGNRMNIGKERYIVSMFVDMRGSTTLAEARLPFDVVFLINRFLEAARKRRSTRAVSRTSSSAMECSPVWARCRSQTACRQAIARRRHGCLQRGLYESPVRNRPSANRSSTASVFMAAMSSSATSAFRITPCSRRLATPSMSRRGCRT